MKTPLPAVGLALLCLSPVVGQGPANDWTIVPGVRVGPVTTATVKSDLARLFPGAAVADQELELDEGMVFPATMVARGTPSESLAIVWTGKDADAHPKQIFVCRGRRRGACKYHAPVPGGDIAVGTKLTELEALNGKDFTIQGFGFGYGGSVLSWDNGKLGKLDCHQSLSLAIDGERDRDGDLAGGLSEQDRGTFTGNRPVSTTTPALRKLNPAVTEILVKFPEPGVKPCPR
ncbi:MAG TPA: hypothetical protein VG273_17610 [Bryobacteraceae bacterium]|jgi:hypothetical protein|nr:hypothetical protein [Bryobacteraceae bacterium]